MHTQWSHDCSIAVPDLLDHAEAIGLGAIAVTDHNRFGGAREAVEQARGRKLTVIPAEEVVPIVARTPVPESAPGVRAAE
jgi:hypothetical protein